MTKRDIERVITILEAAAADKPWLSTGTLTRRLGSSILSEKLQQALLEYCCECQDRDETPKLRYSSLPSKKTLELLWGATSHVGTRQLENITQNHVADDALKSFSVQKDADVFLSHSHRDYQPVIQLAKAMLDKGIAPWLAETHIEQGEHIHDEIIRAMSSSQAFVLFLSLNALDSRWTGKEFINAHKRHIPVFIVANVDSPIIVNLLRQILSAAKPKTTIRPLHQTTNQRRSGSLELSKSAKDFMGYLLGNTEHITNFFVWSKSADDEKKMASSLGLGQTADLVTELAQFRCNQVATNKSPP